MNPNKKGRKKVYNGIEFVMYNTPIKQIIKHPEM